MLLFRMNIKVSHSLDITIFTRSLANHCVLYLMHMHLINDAVYQEGSMYMYLINDMSSTAKYTSFMVIKLRSLVHATNTCANRGTNDLWHETLSLPCGRLLHIAYYQPYNG